MVTTDAKSQAELQRARAGGSSAAPARTDIGPRFPGGPAKASEAVEKARRAMGADLIGLDEWNAAKPAYQARWEATRQQLGGTWDMYEPAYRFAWEMLQAVQYRSRSWNEVEKDLRRGWSISFRELTWDSAALAIRDVWEHVHNAAS